MFGLPTLPTPPDVNTIHETAMQAIEAGTGKLIVRSINSPAYQLTGALAYLVGELGVRIDQIPTRAILDLVGLDYAGSSIADQALLLQDAVKRLNERDVLITAKDIQTAAIAAIGEDVGRAFVFPNSQNRSILFLECAKSLLEPMSAAELEAVDDALLSRVPIGTTTKAINASRADVFMTVFVSPQNVPREKVLDTIQEFLDYRTFYRDTLSSLNIVSHLVRTVPEIDYCESVYLGEEPSITTQNIDFKIPVLRRLEFYTPRSSSTWVYSPSGGEWS